MSAHAYCLLLRAICYVVRCAGMLTVAKEYVESAFGLTSGVAESDEQSKGDDMLGSAAITAFEKEGASKNVCKETAAQVCADARTADSDSVYF